MTFRIRRSANTQYYFTINASNGQTLATSETYWNKSDCLAAVRTIQGSAGSAPVQDQS